MRDHCYVKRHDIEVPEAVEEMVVVDDASPVSSPYDTVQAIEINSPITLQSESIIQGDQEYVSNDCSYSSTVNPSGSPDSSLLDSDLDELLLGNSSEKSESEEKPVLNITDLFLGIDSFNDINVPCDAVEKSLVDVNLEDFKVEEFFANANSLSDLDNLHF